jgi:hypothetical protein
VATTLAVSAGAGCRSGQPLVNRSDDPATPGTIAGVVRSAAGEPLAARRVHAVNVENARAYTAVTGVTGGFSIPVPPGKYRLQVELQEGESVVRAPGVIDIDKSDLDANLEIRIGER